MKGRKARASGGEAMAGKKEYAEDEDKKNMSYTAENKVGPAAEERKDGGKAEGKKAKGHEGRKPRKAGGRVGSNNAPLSSAHMGKAAKGRHAVDID